MKQIFAAVIGFSHSTICCGHQDISNTSPKPNTAFYELVFDKPSRYEKTVDKFLLEKKERVFLCEFSLFDVIRH